MFVLLHNGKRVAQSDAPYMTGKLLKETWGKAKGVPLAELKVVKLT